MPEAKLVCYIQSLLHIYIDTINAITFFDIYVGRQYFQIFLRDGRNKRMKKAQHDHRLEDIKDQWTTMFHYCNDGGLLNGQTSLPKPLLIEEQLFWTLEDLGVEVIKNICIYAVMQLCIY